MGDADLDVAARWCELEGIRQDVDDDLVEVLAVDPDGQMLAVVLITKVDVLGVGLPLKQGVDILDEGNQVGLLHSHLHHTLVDLPQVHHLVDQVEDALRVALDGLIDPSALRVVILFHQREQGRDDEGHRRTDLVANVHKETQFGLAHLLGVDMLLQFQSVLFLPAAVGQIVPDGCGQGHQIEGVGPRRAVPRGVDDDGEGTLGGGLAVTLGLHPEAVGARRQVRDGQFVATWLQAGELLAVDTI